MIPSLGFFVLSPVAQRLAIHALVPCSSSSKLVFARALSHDPTKFNNRKKILGKKELQRRKVETLAKSGSRLKFYLVDAGKFSFQTFYFCAGTVF
jgi:hypothetical protein